MKFTNGYWMLRDEMRAAYAVRVWKPPCIRTGTDDVSAVFPYRRPGKLPEYSASDGDTVESDGRCDQGVRGAS